MGQKSPYLALEHRLITIESRIAALKQNMQIATGPAMVNDAGTISELEGRHKEIKDRLRELDLAGSGLHQSIEAEIAVMADDLTSAVDDVVAWADAGCQPDRHPKRLHVH